MNGPHRYAALDAWRGVCACLVAIVHIPVAHAWISARPFQNMQLFVDFFFVLSGFVICHAYGARLRTRASVTGFVIRRFGRVWPLHVAVLGCFVALELVKVAAGWFVALPLDGTPFAAPRSLPQLVSNLTLTQAFDLHGMTSWNGPAWSIGVEFYTYLVFAALVVTVGPRARADTAAITWGFALLAVTGVVGVVAFSHAWLFTTHDFGFFRCLYGFFTGCLVYQALESHGLRRCVTTSLTVPTSVMAARGEGVSRRHGIGGHPSKPVIDRAGHLDLASQVVAPMTVESQNGHAWVAADSLDASKLATRRGHDGSMVVGTSALTSVLLTGGMGRGTAQETGIPVKASFPSTTDAGTCAEIAVVAALAAFLMLTGPDATSLLAPLVFALIVAVFAAQRGAISKALLSRPAQSLGLWSYSIYMVHMFIFALFKIALTVLAKLPIGLSSPVVEPVKLWTFGSAGLDALLMAVYLAVVLSVARFTYHRVEAPARDRFARAAYRIERTSRVDIVVPRTIPRSRQSALF